jgi:hypothetical protein
MAIPHKTDDYLQSRSIRMAPEVWEALDQDARRCNRSAVKHIEALLATYYGIWDVEIDKNKLDLLRQKRSEDNIKS